MLRFIEMSNLFCLNKYAFANINLCVIIIIYLFFFTVTVLMELWSHALIFPLKPLYVHKGINITLKNSCQYYADIYLSNFLLLALFFRVDALYFSTYENKAIKNKHMFGCTVD